MIHPNLELIDFEDESVHVIQWHGYFSVILIIFLGACGVVSTLGKMFIIHFILTKAPQRPLNKMILCDELGQLVTSFGFILLTLTSLIESSPIKELIPYGCQIFYFVAVAHNTLLVVGGFMMALLRMVCVKFATSLPISLSFLVNIILVIQYGLVIFLLSGYCYSTTLYGSSHLFEFCRGHTTKMAHMLMKYEGIDNTSIQRGKDILSIFMLMAHVMVLLELVFYVVLFYNLKEKNRSLKNVVTDDILKTRARKNTITLVGQFITFAIECFYGILVQVLFHQGSVSYLFEPGAIPCAMMFMLASVPSTQILTSPELRRHFLKG